VIFLVSVVFLGLACLLTFVQTLYLESMRLKTRERPALEFFKDSLEERIGPDTEQAMLAFSMLKHSLLVLGGGCFVLAAGTSSTPQWQVALEGLGIGWLMMVLSSYALPQILYRRTGGRWLVPLLPLLKAMALAVRPVIALLRFLESLFELSNSAAREEEATPEEEIEALINAGEEEGIIEEGDRKLIQSVVAFGDKRVREVMTPRPSIVAIEASQTLEALRKLVIHEQYSRIPVYTGAIDRMIGFVHVRDMFEMDREQRAVTPVTAVMREMRMAPETKLVSELLEEMRAGSYHIVGVVDEYGNVAGIATLEDLVEEILGEIRDEHEPGHDIERHEDGSVTVSGSFDLDHLDELFDFRPAEGAEATTVGGLVTEWLNQVPKPGAVVERHGLRIEVTQADGLRVAQVRIRRVEAS
jgi:CBS domain containing-hemolysin-like protein